MRLIVTLGVIVLLAPGAASSAQESAYSRAEIDAAINIGMRGQIDRIQHGCNAGDSAFWTGFNDGLTGETSERRGFQITGQPPMARVATVAAGARRLYLPAPEATNDRIVSIVRDDVLTIRIVPITRARTAVTLADTGIEQVVIRPRGDNGGGRRTVQPLTLDVAGSDSVTKLFGASVDLEGVVATFASTDVIAIAEDADVEVILITTAGEFKCNLDDTRILRGYNPLDN